MGHCNTNTANVGNGGGANGVNPGGPTTAQGLATAFAANPNVASNNPTA